MLSPFSITRPRSPGGPLGSMTASPSQDKEQIDIVAFTGTRTQHVHRQLEAVSSVLCDAYRACSVLLYKLACVSATFRGAPRRDIVR